MLKAFPMSGNPLGPGGRGRWENRPVFARMKSRYARYITYPMIAKAGVSMMRSIGSTAMALDPIWWLCECLSRIYFVRMHAARAARIGIGRKGCFWGVRVLIMGSVTLWTVKLTLYALNRQYPCLHSTPSPKSSSRNDSEGFNPWDWT